MILLLSTNFHENLNMLGFEGFKWVLRVLTKFLGFGVGCVSIGRMILEQVLAGLE